jgi:hypothetical protein
MRSFVVKPGAGHRTTATPAGAFRTPKRRHELTIEIHAQLRDAGYTKSASWELAKAIADLEAPDSALDAAVEEAKARLTGKAPTQAPAEPSPSPRSDIASKVDLVVRDLEAAHGVSLEIATVLFDPRTRSATINLIESRQTPQGATAKQSP